MTKGIFITATGTDVGKTYVSALIVKKMRELGFNCGYYKPALSGAYRKNGELVAGDCEHVQLVSGLEGDSNSFASYIFETAVSPHLAAKIEKNPIKLEKIISDFNVRTKKHDYVVVEGAGGVVCPFNIEDNLLLADVIKALNLSAVVVAGTKLGSINSAVLTTEYLKNKNINIEGLILNNYNPSDFMELDNKLQIANLSGCKILAEVSKNSTDINIDNDALLAIFKEL